MSSKVTVKTGSPLRVWDRRDSRIVVDEMSRRVIARTQSAHVGADGRPFRPYADGRDEPVDLTQTGAMLGTMAEQVNDTGARLTATVPYARAVDRLRPWLGFTEAELDALFDGTVLRLVDEAIVAANKEARING